MARRRAAWVRPADYRVVRLGTIHSYGASQASYTVVEMGVDSALPEGTMGPDGERNTRSMPRPAAAHPALWQAPGRIVWRHGLKTIRQSLITGPAAAATSTS
jgi:hypothetical protein